MLLLRKRWRKCHKYIGKPAADHMHHFLLCGIFERDNLGLSLNLEKIWKFFGKNCRRKIWGKNYHISISFSEFSKML